MAQRVERPRKPLKKDMEIREYTGYNEDEIRRLYEAVGWTAYLKDTEALKKGFMHSLLVLAAYDNEGLSGIIRVVGDGHTVVFIQDLLVYPKKQRQGIGTALVKAVLNRFPNVRQIQLTTDNAPLAAAFYTSLGFTELSGIGCCGFMRQGGNYI